MKYILAISGGIDSVVLLDMLMRPWVGGGSLTDKFPGGLLGEFEQGVSPPFVVAHFDHGIRSDSADDAHFVQGLAAMYGLEYVTDREELGPKASEDLARQRRYAFLSGQARNHDAVIVTAHHADDIVETVALNLSRGTGWRGLAALDNPKVKRPLLGWTKRQIREYALDNRLEWVEDSTNLTTIYLRNHLRRLIGRGLSVDEASRVLNLRQEQVELKRVIDEEVLRLVELQSARNSRYFFTQIDPLVASEILRGLAIEAGYSLTRPQLNQILIAIKTARPKTRLIIGKMVVEFGVKTFSITVKTP